jgi:hypothetical protein
MLFRNKTLVVYSARAQECGDRAVLVHHGAFAQASFTEAIAESQKIQFFDLIGEDFTAATQELGYETLVGSNCFMIAADQTLLE